MRRHQVWRRMHEKSKGNSGQLDSEDRVARQSLLVPYPSHWP